MSTPEQQIPQEGRDPTRRRQLWKLYAHSRKLVKEEQADFQRVNQMVIDASAQYGLGLDGIMSLQKELGIDADFDEPTSRADNLRGGIAKVAGGAYLGGADELAGAVDAAIPGGRGYTEGRDRIRDRQDRFSAEHPKTGLGLELAGMAIPATATGGLATGAMKGGGSLLARSAQGGATMGILGGGEAAAYGALSSDEETMGGRMKDSLLSGGIGSAASGILGAAGPWVAALGRQGLRAGEAIGVPGVKAVRNMSARKAAERELRQTLQQYDLSPEDIAEAIRKMPEGSVVADYAEGLAATAQGARRASGDLALPGSAVDKIKIREAGKSDRVVEALRGGTGLARVENPDTILEVGKKLWREEMEEPFLAQMGESTFGSARLRRLLSGNDMMEEAIHSGGGVLGDIKQAQQMSVEVGWDAIKYLDDKLSLKADGTTKLNTGDYRRAKLARDALRELMEDGVPGFTDMRASYAGLMGRYRAYNVGRGARLKPAREITREIADAGDHAQAYREGLMDAWEEQIHRTPSTIELVGGRGNIWMDRIRNLYPEGSVGDRAFFDFVDNVANENRWNGTFRALKGRVPAHAQGASDELGAVITRGPSLANEIISIFISDPQLRGRAARQLTDILLSEGPEAMIQAAIRAERAAVRGAAGRGTAILGTTKLGQAGAEGMAVAPPQEMPGLLNTGQPPRPRNIFE